METKSYVDYSLASLVSLLKKATALVNKAEKTLDIKDIYSCVIAGVWLNIEEGSFIDMVNENRKTDKELSAYLNSKEHRSSLEAFHTERVKLLFRISELMKKQTKISTDQVAEFFGTRVTTMYSLYTYLPDEDVKKLSQEEFNKYYHIQAKLGNYFMFGGLTTSVPHAMVYGTTTVKMIKDDKGAWQVWTGFGVVPDFKENPIPVSEQDFYKRMQGTDVPADVLEKFKKLLSEGFIGDDKQQSKPQSEPRQTEPIMSVSADSVINRLKELGYFKYVPEAQLADIIGRVKTSFEKNKTLGAFVNPELEDSYESLMDLSTDGLRRFFFADAEEIGEGSLQSDVIDKMKALNLFQVEGLPELKVEESEGPADKVVSLLIGDEKIVLWDGSRTADSFSRGLDIAVKFCQALNDYCVKNQKSPRFYIQYGGGNDQEVAVLTEDLYNYFLSLKLDKEWMPVEPIY